MTDNMAETPSRRETYPVDETIGGNIVRGSADDKITLLLLKCVDMFQDVTNANHRLLEAVV